HDEEEQEDKLYREVNINQGRGIQATLEVEDSHVTLTPVNPDGMESIFETTSQMDAQTPTLVAPLPMSAPTITPTTIDTITTTQQAPLPPTTASSTLLQDLPKFWLAFAGAVSAIPRIVQRYMDQRMNEAVKVFVQIQYDRLRDEAQKENDEFLKTIDENMQQIIKEQVKEQVKVLVSKILPTIEQTVNEQLEAEVLTRSSHSSRTSYVVVADLSEMELKKILIEKMEGNKSIQRSDEQMNLYKARRRDDDVDKDEEPSAGPNRGSKRCREGKEPESASAPTETATRSAGRLTQGSQSRQASASESATAEEPMQTTFQMEKPSHPEFDTGAEDQPIAQSSRHPEWFSQQQKPPTPDPGPTYELLEGSCKSLVELEYQLEEVYKATTDQLDWVNPEGASSRKYTTSVTKTKAADYRHIKWIEDLVPRIIIIVDTELKIVEWHNYKHLDWITVRRDDDKVYKFKEGDFKRLRIQDIEDMLLLLVQGKLTNLTVEERFAFNKKLNLTKPDTYRSDLKRKEAYIAYSNLQGFIYQNKDKKNRLLRIDELHKFSDETLTDVHTALDDHLKGIQMHYLPQSIWRKSDKDRATAMIQAINKTLKQGGS
nr:hypothetical protein [Tanacetum cinerariifolium]